MFNLGYSQSVPIMQPMFNQPYQTYPPRQYEPVQIPQNNNPYFNFQKHRDNQFRKLNDMEIRHKEDNILEALDKQTEVLMNIAIKYKQRAEQEEKFMLARIKKLEQENKELLMLQKNDEIVNQRVNQKIRNLKRLGYFINPNSALNDPFYLPPLNQDEQFELEYDIQKPQQEEPENQKRKSQRKSKKL